MVNSIFGPGQEMKFITGTHDRKTSGEMVEVAFG
jgi:hypothetical protein